METLRKMLGTPKVQERCAAMAEARGKFAPLSDRTIELLRGGRFDAAATLRVTEVGTAQVGEAVADIDRATRRNAALVEQSAAAAESLRSQAAGPVSLLGAFGVGSNASAGRPA